MTSAPRVVVPCGPYCPIPQDDPRYVHVIYPPARGLVRDENGQVREMTTEELEQLKEVYMPHLAYSFEVPQ